MFFSFFNFVPPKHGVKFYQVTQSMEVKAKALCIGLDLKHLDP